MDKLKSTYRVNGEEIRLLDPDHFYAYASSAADDSGCSFEMKLERYVKANPSKVTLAEPF